MADQEVAGPAAPEATSEVSSAPVAVAPALIVAETGNGSHLTAADVRGRVVAYLNGEIAALPPSAGDPHIGELRGELSVCALRLSRGGRS